MAAEREVIREFLATLGFEVSVPGLKKFVDSLGSVTKFAATTGAAIIGVAAAAEAMLQVFARSQERIYYLSKRTGASVTNIKALEYGFGQIGLSAEDAEAAVDSFAQNLRTQPGLMALMRSLGVDTRQQDPTKLFKGLIRQLSRLPYFIGVQWAQQFGINEQLFRQLTLPGALDALEEAERRVKDVYRAMGIDQEKAAQSSKEYMNTLRELWSEVGVVGDSLLIQLLPAFKDWSKALSEMLFDLAHLDIHSLDFSLKYLNGFLDQQLQRWGTWGDRIKTVKDYLLAIPSWAIKWFDRNNSAIGGLIANTFGPGKNTTFIPQPGSPLGLRQNNPGNLRSWGKALIKNGFAVFSSQDEGLSALAGNLLSYSRHGINTLSGIVNRYAPPGENNTAGYLQALVRATGFAPGQPINLQDPRVLSELMGAIIRQEQGFNPFGQSQLLAAANARLGNNITVTQNNTFNISSTDPAAAGRAAGSEANRVSADLVRNLAGAMR